MGFRSAQQSNEQAEAADRSTAHRSPATDSASEHSTPDPSMMGQIWPSIERAEQHFEMQIPDESTLQRLEDHERTYGRETHEWIAEGMPVDAMGSPKSMEAFRQRQADRPPEVPTNIERQNRHSVLRSEKAATETEPAVETGVPEPVREVISSRGRSLDGSIQRAMEDRMGDSFGDVRIHTGSTAASACESINARAFTVGNHIAFNSGEYDPSSPEGQHVLAHELAHVRQQNQGAVSMLPQEDMELEVDPDPALEREAEEAAQQAMADGPVVVNRMGCEMQIQRMSAGDLSSKLKDAIGIDDKDFTEYIDNKVQEAIDKTGEATDSAQSFGESLTEGAQRGWTSLTNTRVGSVASDLAPAWTKGAVGSTASAIVGGVAGREGGAALGATLGATAGTLLGPFGTAAGMETGRRIGAEAGDTILGGAASDATKELADYTLPNGASKQVKQLQEQFEELREDLNKVQNEMNDFGGNDSQGLAKSRRE